MKSNYTTKKSLLITVSIILLFIIIGLAGCTPKYGCYINHETKEHQHLKCPKF